MRLIVTRKSLSWILRWTQRALFAGAASLLAYCGFVLLDAWIFQKAGIHQLERLKSDSQTAPESPASFNNLPATVLGGFVGRIEIPRLGVSAIVIEGISAKTLRRAVGHIPGTDLPGHPGNVGISGHRDTFFRPLRNIQQNDIITLTTLDGEYRYRVVSIGVVDPYDVAVLDPDRNQILTLVTCFPFYFVGAAPDRFIVRAERENL